MEQSRRGRWRIRGFASAATVAAGVALAGPGFAAGAEDPPEEGRISAINNADEVRAMEAKAAASPQVQQAEAKAQAAQARARKAVSAATQAKKKAAASAQRAKQLGTPGARRSAAEAKAAAKKANAKAKAAKQASARAAAHAEEVRRSVMRGESSSKQAFLADSSQGATTTDDSRRSVVLDLANQARSAAGCKPLTYHSLLERSAQGHAEDMARYNYMGHVSKDGRTFDQRIRATGFDGDRIGENVGAGFSTASGVVDAWMRSPAHRANILDCRYHYLGVGYVVGGGYWVQNFGS